MKPIKHKPAATPRPIQRPTGNSSASAPPPAEVEALPGDSDDGAVTLLISDEVTGVREVVVVVVEPAETEAPVDVEADEDEAIGGIVDDDVSVDDVLRTKSVPHCAGRQVLAMHSVNGRLATHCD